MKQLVPLLPSPSAPVAAPTEPGLSPSKIEEPAPGDVLVQPDEFSLAARITPDTPPQQAVSLRLAEEGRKLLQEKQYETGLTKLEKAISLDSRNPYAYYYLAKAHYHLASHKHSLNFLEIVEPSFSDEPLWLARIYALQAENYRAQGFFERAARTYLKALALDPLNRIALDGLTYLPAEVVSPTR